MAEYINITRHIHTDLNMYHCGTEKCEPGHFYGPAVRDHFLIHYILNCKGIFQVGNVTYHLGKGQGFLICPGIVTYYRADSMDPWNYSWVGFHGLKAEIYLKYAGLNSDNPIFEYDRDDFIRNCFDQMIAAKNMIKTGELWLLGILYLFLSKLIEANGTERFLDSNGNVKTNGDLKQLYISKAIQYIEMNYSRKISISEIARYIGLDRSYLGSIFINNLNTSPQQFLINFRINKACELMRNNNLSIGDISRSVGYQDPLLFSKIFRKTKGQPPKQYRKMQSAGVFNPNTYSCV